jgi:hypothetical protein
MEKMDGNYPHNYPFHNQRRGLHTYLYSLSPSLDITLILKIPTGHDNDANTWIKFSSYRARGLSDVDSSETASQVEKE